MENQQKLRLWLEIVWLLATVVVVVAVIWPIRQVTANYPFLWMNVGFIVAAITFARYVFFMKHTLIAKAQRTKIVLTILVLPVILTAIGFVNHFITWIAENDFTPIFGHLADEKRAAMERFTWNEMVFFGVATVVGGGAFLVRLIISLWRTHNLDEA